MRLRLTLNGERVSATTAPEATLLEVLRGEFGVFGVKHGCETGAIQCGYCTPAMILAARALLAEQPDPDDEDVREALSGVLCRCTGYLKPVDRKSTRLNSSHSQ